MYDIRLTKQAVRDAEKIERAGMKLKVMELLRVIRVNPYQNPPEYEKLFGDYKGAYSHRINKQHRLVYEVLPNDEGIGDSSGEPYKGIIKILRMWTHYE